MKAPCLHRQMEHCSGLTFFFFNDTAPTEIYTLSLHDALPICGRRSESCPAGVFLDPDLASGLPLESTPKKDPPKDRKSTRLNSSHANISYAVFCLKKKTPCTAP